MSDTSTGNHNGAGWYEIRLKGHLDSRWAAWFDGLSLTNHSDGTTVISGPVSTRQLFTACSSECATSAYRWSRSLRSTPTSPTYPPSPDRRSRIHTRRTT